MLVTCFGMHGASFTCISLGSTSILEPPFTFTVMRKNFNGVKVLLFFQISLMNIKSANFTLIFRLRSHSRSISLYKRNMRRSWWHSRVLIIWVRFWYVLVSRYCRWQKSRSSLLPAYDGDYENVEKTERYVRIRRSTNNISTMIQESYFFGLEVAEGSHTFYTNQREKYHASNIYKCIRTYHYSHQTTRKFRLRSLCLWNNY